MVRIIFKQVWLILVGKQEEIVGGLEFESFEFFLIIMHKQIYPYRLKSSLIGLDVLSGVYE